MEENRAGGESVEAERALGSYFAWGEGCNVYIHNHFSICFIKLLSIGQMAQKPKEVHFQRPEVQKPERTESQTLKNPRTQKPKSPNVGNPKSQKKGLKKLKNLILYTSIGHIHQSEIRNPALSV